MTGCGAPKCAGGYSEATHREAAGRFANFVKSDRALPVLRKWGPWLKTTDGKRAWDQLFALADDLLCAFISTPKYEWTLALLAATWTMPLEDFEIIARCAFEFCRCCFFGAGYMPSADIGPDQGGGCE